MQASEKDESPKVAVAYYRHYFMDGEENCIPVQRRIVGEFAKEHDIEIVEEFVDFGKDRYAFESMQDFYKLINEYVIRGKKPFDIILVRNMNRWPYYRYTEIARFYQWLCVHMGKQIIFTDFGFPKQGEGNKVLEDLENFINTIREFRREQ